jgi:hypothetical protein
MYLKMTMFIRLIGMKSLELLNRLKQLESQTQTALFSYNQVKVLFADENEKTMYTALCRHVKNAVIERVCKGVWLNPLSSYANNDTRLEELALLLRPDHYNYVSMETVLSQASIISQQMFGYLTIMTSGSSKTIKTTFGTLEFIHTKRDWIELSRHIIPDGHKLPWANIAMAYRDLKRSGRNVKMIDLDMLKLFMDKNVEEIDD